MARGSRGVSVAAVIVQTGSNDLDNLGDVAMLEVLLERIRGMQKDVSFSVFARDAGKVRALGSDVQQIDVEPKSEWAVARAAYLRTRRFAPVIDDALKNGLPSFYRSLIRSKARALANGDAVRKSRMLIVSGGGFLTDVFPGQAWPVFERLRVAIDAGIPVALMGQGVGPLRDAALVEAARSTLPQAELIAVRESLYSVPILLGLGVAPDRIVVTGDDAIEPSYRMRREASGSSLGVNVRVADYAGTRGFSTARLRDILTGIAAANSAELVPLPVCIVDSPDTASDAAIMAKLFPVSGIADAAETLTTRRLIERVGECRIVVTGSYHGAVFALSQGIPAACLFGSEYYEMKFRGLRAQFGDGCELIDMNDEGFAAQLEKTVDALWQRAADYEETLLAAARNQIAEGHRAYERLSGMLGASA